MPTIDPTEHERSATDRPTPLTESRTSADVLQASAELLHSQNRVLELVARGAPLNEIFDLYLRSIELQSPGMLSSILLLEEDGVHVRHAAAPSLPEGYTRAIDGMSIGPTAGSCGTAAYRAKPVVVEDIATDPLWADYKEVALPHGLRACWSTPILDSNGRVLGTFALYFRMPGRPSPRHRHLIGVTTHVAALAILADRERRETSRRLAQLEDAERVARTGSFEWDAATDRLRPSRELAAIFGVAPDAFAPTLDAYLQRVHPDDRARAREAIDRAVRDRVAFDLEARILRSDGEVRVLRGQGDWTATPEGERRRLIGVCRDVTDRK